jgi:hypothetical protein
MDMGTLWEMAKPIVAGQIRTAMAGVAGGLATAGAIQGDQKTAFVSMSTGIILYIIPAAWSWWEKVGKVQIIAMMAKSKPVVPPNASTGDAVKAATEAQKVST